MRTHFTSIALIICMMIPSLASAEEAVGPLTLGDPVLYWNAVALELNAVDHSGIYGVPDQIGPDKTARALAIMHAAIFDAVNSIDGSYKPYIANVPVKGVPASIDAAVSEAGYTTLIDLYPKQKSYINASYKSFMAQVPPGPAKLLGTSIGKVTATQNLLARRRDGSDKEIAYTPNSQPGYHRPDPINPNQGFWGPNWGNVKPMVLTSGSQFRVPPPPALDSVEYAEAFNEVKFYGSDGISFENHRDQNQTDMGIYWAYDGVKGLGTPPRLYNQIVRQIALQEQNTVVENARLFALVNIAQNDGGIAAWESKYYYNFWRPIVAIREADAGTGPSGLGDNNPLTEGDLDWTPLGAPATNSLNSNFTPNFPAYPSGHATFGGATFEVVKRFYGTDNISFTFMSDEMNGVNKDNLGNVRPATPRTYTNLEQAIYENAKSRVYLGIHWTFDATSGITLGKTVGDYVFDNILKPVSN